MNDYRRFAFGETHIQKGKLEKGIAESAHLYTIAFSASPQNQPFRKFKYVFVGTMTSQINFAV